MLFLLPLVLFAQEKSSISGTVVNFVTGDPVGKAEITLEPIGGGPKAATVAGPDGRFTMVDLEPGRYRLTAERSGYLETRYGARQPDGQGTVLELQKGEAQRRVNVRIIPAAVIAGTVRDADSEPMEGIHVTIGKRVREHGIDSIQRDDSTETDDLGQYRFYRLEPGRYYVSAAPRSAALNGADHSPREAGPHEGAVTTFYPGTLRESLASPIEVTPGAHIAGIDIILLRAPTFSVSGRATNVKNGEVVLVDGQDEGMSKRQVPIVNGRFELRGVISGAYLLKAMSGDLLQATSTVQVGDADVTGIMLTLAPGASVAGQVTVEGPVQPSLRGRSIYLTAGRGTGQLPEIAADGTFNVPRLFPGTYHIEFFGQPNGTYVKSIVSGTVDVLRDGLMVSGGGTLPLLIVLATDGARISGLIRAADEKPIAGATVLLRGHSTLHATADQNGKYEITSVPPGDYKLFAWEDVEPGAWNDPEFLTRYETRAIAVNVQANGSATEDLRALR